MGSIVGGDTGSDDRAGNTTGSSEGNLGGDEHIGNVLIFTEQGQVKEDLEGLGIGSHDDKLRDTSVQSLGGLIGSFLQLLIVGSLLHQVEDGDREGIIG